mmetsp:Transcript_629/g.2340  ORF Transcript_629/g.2340 Transcript_629/m.2340 type:complete len:252 (-) Transcript_629:13144-13899(-)
MRRSPQSRHRSRKAPLSEGVSSTFSRVKRLPRSRSSSWLTAVKFRSSCGSILSKATKALRKPMVTTACTFCSSVSADGSSTRESSAETSSQLAENCRSRMDSMALSYVTPITAVHGLAKASCDQPWLKELIKRSSGFCKAAMPLVSFTRLTSTSKRCRSCVFLMLISACAWKSRMRGVRLDKMCSSKARTRALTHRKILSSEKSWTKPWKTKSSIRYARKSSMSIACFSTTVSMNRRSSFLSCWRISSIVS